MACLRGGGASVLTSTSELHNRGGEQLREGTRTPSKGK